MANFFSSFPLYYYKDTLCKNIVQRTTIAKEVKAEYSAFYDHQLSDGDRPDMIAHRAYNNSYYDWLLYYANDIVDPYFGWYLDTSDFNKYIKDVYGSVAQAQESIAYYRVNWYSNDRSIETSAYEALPSYLRKYWAASYDEANRPIYYTRSPIGTLMGTNKMVEMSAASLDNFVVGERVHQTNGSAVTAAGNIVRKGSTLTVQHIEGVFTTGHITGLSSDAVTAVADPIIIAVSIVDAEAAYWEPVSNYDRELEINESKKNIRIMLPTVARRVEQAHKDLLA